MFLLQSIFGSCCGPRKKDHSAVPTETSPLLADVAEPSASPLSPVPSSAPTLEREQETFARIAREAEQKMQDFTTIASPAPTRTTLPSDDGHGGHGGGFSPNASGGVRKPSFASEASQDLRAPFALPMPLSPAGTMPTSKKKKKGGLKPPTEW